MKTYLVYVLAQRRLLTASTWMFLIFVFIISQFINAQNSGELKVLWKDYINISDRFSSRVSLCGGTALYIVGYDATRGLSFIESKQINTGKTLHYWRAGNIELYSCAVEGDFLYVVGSQRADDADVWLILKFATDLKLLQKTEYKPSAQGGEAYAVTTDGKYIYVGGYEITQGNKYWHIIKISPSDLSVLRRSSYSFLGEVLSVRINPSDGRLWLLGTAGSRLPILGGATHATGLVDKNFTLINSTGFAAGIVLYNDIAFDEFGYAYLVGRLGVLRISPELETFRKPEANESSVFSSVAYSGGHLYGIGVEAENEKLDKIVLMKMSRELDVIEKFALDKVNKYSLVEKSIAVGDKLFLVAMGSNVTIYAVQLSQSPSEISSCVTITQPGHYILASDIYGLQTGRSHCIEIVADNVVLDGNGHAVTGRGDGVGILINARNVIVSNIRISNYSTGVTVLSRGNIIKNSIISNNKWGIELGSGSELNTVTNCTVVNNELGIFIYMTSTENLIYNNYFRNVENVKTFIAGPSAPRNFWNVTKRAGRNIVGGPYVGGNYWGRLDGAGFSDTCADRDLDGICDAPYQIDQVNIDYLPLAKNTTKKQQEVARIIYATDLKGDYTPSGDLYNNFLWLAAPEYTSIPDIACWAIVAGTSVREDCVSKVEGISMALEDVRADWARGKLWALAVYDTSWTPPGGFYILEWDSGKWRIATQISNLRWDAHRADANLIDVTDDGKVVTLAHLTDRQGRVVDTRLVVFDPSTKKLADVSVERFGLPKNPSSATLAVYGGRVLIGTVAKISETAFRARLVAVDPLTLSYKDLLDNAINAHAVAFTALRESGRPKSYLALVVVGDDKLAMRVYSADGLVVSKEYLFRPGTKVELPMVSLLADGKYFYLSLIAYNSSAKRYELYLIGDDRMWEVWDAESLLFPFTAYVKQHGIVVLGVGQHPWKWGTGRVILVKDPEMPISLAEIRRDGDLVTREISNITIYSEYSGFFYSGFNINNTFYVNISGREVAPKQVIGMLGDKTFSFVYNETVKMWTATVNMGRLRPGVNNLTVVITYPDGVTLSKTYAIAVLQPPKLLLDVAHRYSGDIRVDLGSVRGSVRFIVERRGYWGNSFQIEIELGVSAKLSPVKIDGTVVGGIYKLPSLELAVQFTLSSSGEVTVGGALSLETMTEIMSVPIKLMLASDAEGTFVTDLASSSVILQDLRVRISLLASGSKTLPLKGIMMSLGPIKLEAGVVVEIVAAGGAGVSLVFTPTDTRSNYFLGVLPLALNEVYGVVGTPFILTGRVGAGSWQSGREGGRVGVWGWLQGIGGFGYYLQSGSQFVKGYALVGEVRAGVTINLIVYRFSDVLTLWGGGRVGGEVSRGDLGELKQLVNKVADAYGYPPLGLDWVNGSWNGIVAEMLPNGYTYSSVEYGDKVYIYYTYLRPDGTSWIGGYLFEGLNASNIATPPFKGVGVGSPYLFRLLNGTVAMLWAAAPMRTDLNNLRIVLQLSYLRDGTWREPINITDTGVAWAYTSDGRYIYVIWTPAVTADLYSNTVLRVYDTGGRLLWERALPGAMAVSGAVDGEVVVGFVNGSYAIVSAEGVKNLGVVAQAGSVAGADMFYIYVNGSLKLFNRTASIEIEVGKPYAWPAVVAGRTVIVAYVPGSLELYIWNGTALLKLREYKISNVTTVSMAYTRGLLYIFPYLFKNEDRGVLQGLIVPFDPPEPSLQVEVHGRNATVNWFIKDFELYNITGIELEIFHGNTPVYKKRVGAVGGEEVLLAQGGRYIFRLTVATLLGKRAVEKIIDVNNTLLCPLSVGGVLPGDVDGDGLFEDFNGNGVLDFSDVVLFFRYFDSQEVQQCRQLYDFNKNGKLDLNDVIQLFRRVGS